ncbi:MAG TPA: hypothetical protein VJC05_01580 [Candidatus Andersenbacteria bacterium]|nr:hypothetical protein [Candidatus Andersenbacteria bacterium]
MLVSGFLKTRLQRALLVSVALIGALAAALLTLVAYVQLACQVPPSQVVQTPPRERAGSADYHRSEESTYLTFPEWYMVYSADEYAAFLRNNPSSQFPYFKAVGQFWHSYSCVYHFTKDRYQFNSENHTVLSVIGTSFIIENGVKGLYEQSVGYLTELFTFGHRVEEEVYAQAVAAEYGTFLHTIPWYEFPFGEKLRGLWTQTPWWGKSPVRKWERKLALSAEYGGKGLYAALIKRATRSTFAPAELEIYATIDSRSTPLLAQEPRLRVVQRTDTATTIVSPRYEAFTQIMLPLLRQGLQFQDIAGNDEILVTVLALADWHYTGADAATIFALPILTNEQQRVALQARVAALHQIIPALEQAGVTIEHLYDY